jgi:hypothetical protein
MGKTLLVVGNRICKVEVFHTPLATRRQAKALRKDSGGGMRGPIARARDTLDAEAHICNVYTIRNLSKGSICVAFDQQSGVRVV